MRRRLFLPLLLSALMAGSAGGAAGAESVTVETQDFKFAPLDVAVTVGDTIVFRNTGEAPHNAQADDGSFKIALINPGAEEKVVLKKAGTISYVCTFHKSQAMKGTIVVKEAAGAPPASDASDSKPESAVEEVDPVNAAEAPEPPAQVPPSEKYFPFLAVGLLVLLMGALGLGYLRYILKSAGTRT